MYQIFILLYLFNLNLNSEYSNIISQPITSVNDSLILCLDEPELIEGETVCYPVSVYNFKNLQTLQFAITYDPEQISYIDVKGLDPEYYMYKANLNSPFEGNIRFSWYHPNGEMLNIDDGKDIFELCFNVKNAIPPEDYIYISNSMPGGIEATNIDDQSVPVVINCDLLASTFDLISIAEWSISPNPAQNIISLAIPFHNQVQKACIYDISGKKQLEINSLPEENTEIDISSLVNGTYIVELVTSRGKIKLRFIKH